MSRSPRRPSSSRGPRDRRRTGAYITIVAALAIVAFVVLVIDHGLTGALRVLVGQDPEGGRGTPGPGTSADAEQAQRLLAEIPVEEPRPRGDYERDEFGSSWVDTDDNGCSTRHDILARDLDRVQVAGDCKVTEGVLDDPYTGERLEFTSEDPQAVQIDHVVPLSLAWRMGASEWDRDTRIEFANDPDNLLASDGPANMSKGDAGPGEWQPYEGFQCEYAVAYVEVTHRYELAVSAEDREGLDRMLGTCA
ncbi:HNH endonuclease family protein [Nocardiopsis composta]|uniref:GmrSD restriction endonucleases C-terminal domain-containing protein n=1 Tax=Nocardiopsis composta TaxID=157465 RepID=A0A7W8QKZ2_9ACTN|nr:HNH endonuclease family protein [Nocardiopsis composta]MBB5431703.1 hypothetical protein [Nocardiopsis composta]